uniref:ArnT family glycosyltransferase n=1 Tax=Candidatus Electrothrix sp. TaxID=2170559 RepID=UPI004055A113
MKNISQQSKQNINFRKYTNLSVLLCLFILAFSLRLGFQANSEVYIPIRADAAQYFSVASNLYNYGAYSSKFPQSSNVAPETDFQRPPGYPFFLYPILASANTLGEFVQRVNLAQALISSLMVLLLFATCKLFWPTKYAFVPALLSAVSPHLIAIDQYLLTETLFTFAMVLAMYLTILAFKKENIFLFFLAGLVLGYMVLIKPVAMILGPFLISAFVLFNKRKIITKSIFIKGATLFITGYLLVYSPYVLIRSQHSNDGSISGQTVWDKVVIGFDIGLKNFLANKADPDRIAESQKMYNDKKYAVNKMVERFKESPLKYLSWYLYGKQLFLWKWDNIYIGDVYQYPMIKKGFDQSLTLAVVHRIMYIFHWPLYCLFLFGILILCRRNLCGNFKGTDHYFLTIPLFIMVYYMGIFTILVPLPRYGIPLRPFSYLIAVYALKEFLVPRIKLLKIRQILK